MEDVKGLRLLFAWARLRAGALMTGIVCAGVFFSVWMLTNAALSDALYALAVCALLLLPAAVADFFRVRARHMAMLALCASPPEALPPAVESDTLPEGDWAALYTALAARARRESDESQRRHHESLDYYVMWAHQVKTPIAALRLLCTQPEAVREMHKLERYVGMALEYVRAADISCDLVPARVDADAVARECVRRYAVLFVGRGLSAKVSLTGVYLMTDAKWLAFIIEQLLSNAVKYTERGGVTIFMENGALCVRDTGCGIRADDLPRVFDRGYTGARGRLETRATGLGLYLSRRVARALGGDLTLDSVPGAGTTARLTLPCGEAAPRL